MSSTDFVVRELDKLLSRPLREDEKMKKGSTLYFQFHHVYSALLQAQKELHEQQETNILKLKQSTHDAKILKAQFCSDLRTIDKELSEVHSQSRDLSESCSKLSVDFTQITDRLDSATSLVRKADTISLYLNNIKTFGSSNNFESVLSSLRITSFPTNDEFKAAEQVSKLLKLISISDISDASPNKPLASAALSNLESYRARLSSSLISDFKDKLTSGATDSHSSGGRHSRAHSPSKPSVDPHELHEYVKALSYLQLGQNAINDYISRFPIFFSPRYTRLHFGSDILKLPFDQIFENYSKLCSAISSECTKLWDTIDVIFDPTQQVKIKLLRNIFDGIIYDYVHNVLEHFEGISPFDFCRMLENMYRRTSSMLESILKLDNQQYTSLNLMDKVFRDNQSKYSAQERIVLDDSMKQLIRGPMSLLDKFESQNVITRIIKSNEDSIDPFTIFDETICSQILSIASSTWERCALLSLPENVEGDLQGIMDCFLNKTLYAYILRFVRCCSQHLAASGCSKYVGMFIKMLIMVNSFVLTLEDKYTKSLKGILIHHSAAHARFNASRGEFIRRLEIVIRDGLSNCVSVVASHAKSLLSGAQRKTDFNPPAESAPVRSGACGAFVGFVRDFIADTRASISGENRVSFYTAVGSRLLEVVREHLLQYKYNTYGALALNIDSNEYESAFELFQIDELRDGAAALHACASLMITDLRSLARDEGKVARIVPQGSEEFARKLLSQNVELKSSDIDAFFKKFVK